MLKYHVSKYFFTSTVLLTCFLLCYIFVAYNSCIFTNLKLTLANYEKDGSKVIITRNPYRDKYGYDSRTVVRVVPLSGQNDFENNTDASPKYRFLRQQGLMPSRKLPDALIIGVKKGGTRALLEFVRLHPDVRAAGSEVHFFDKFYWKGFRWYRHRMPATLEGQVTMEKTPSYFITKEVPKRVYKMNPATKLIVVVRDPVTRAISDYTQAASKKPDMKNFEELAFINGSDGIVNTSWGPVKIGVGERLIMDPAAEITRVQDFLGLKRIITEKYFYFNATKGFPCLMKSEGHSSPHCLGKTKGRNHPPIQMYALHRLRNFYRPFNEKFYQMTGINFGWP